MSDFNWCHGPHCHEKHTVDRVRGVKGSKVLRTRRIKVYQPQTPHIYDFFCNQSCLMDYIKTHLQSIIAIAPRREAQETPINVSKETVDHPYWGKQTNTNIEVDETRTNSIG